MFDISVAVLVLTGVIGEWAEEAVKLSCHAQAILEVLP
jgi:hypothetical protein